MGEITFHVEPLKDIWDDIERLANAHWNETETHRHHQKLNINKQKYNHYNESDYHVMYTARDDGYMFGCCGMYFSDSMHTGARIANEDNFFILPEYRNKKHAFLFHQFIESDLFSKGVDEIVVTTKVAYPKAAKFFEKIGYELIGQQFYKRRT